MSTQAGKDVIYVDIDDEITAIIDKVRVSDEKIVALVLPKRATVLQSIVNMKLLKRTADESKKRLVLITGEAGLLPLAGSVGLYVAKTLQSKPEVPEAPLAHGADHDEPEDTVSMADEAEEELDKSAPVSEHVKNSKKGAAASVAAVPEMDEDEPIELDNTGAEPSAAAATGKKSKGKGSKKFNIPNFDKFRLWIIVGGVALVVFIVMWYMAFVALPHADIVIKTDSTALQSSMDVTLDTEADSVNVGEGTIPAEMQTTQKSYTQQADATGQKDNGTKASGTIKFYNCNLEDLIAGTDHTIPAGTGVTANGLTFITQQAVTVSPSNYQGPNCKNNKPSSTINIIAQSVGEKYNQAAATYNVANSSTISGQGSATTGGSSQIIKVVSQADVDNAKQKITAQDATAIKQELKQGLSSKGWFPIEATFKTEEGETTVNPVVGTEAASVTVTEKVTYSMMGVKQDDLKKLVANDVKDQIDESKQAILDYGLVNAVYKPQNQQATTTLLSVDTTAVAGSDLNLAEIKKQVAGKKSGDAKSIIGDFPGVTSVDVRYRPFWVSSTPKNTGKINITVEKPVIKNNNGQQ